MNCRQEVSVLSVVLLGISGSAAAQTAGVFDIRFNLDGASADQQEVFDNAATFWESVIVGYAPGVTLDGIEIDVTLEGIDGEGGTLAMAGPGGFVTEQGGFTFLTNAAGTTSTASITVDTADFGDEFLQTIVNHEVGHTLGFGTLLWTPDFNGVYINGTGEYTGASGIAAYQDEFDSTATFVPIELDGGSGTADAHLNEDFIFDDDGAITGLSLTGITDQFGRDQSNELLTGFLGPDASETFLSNTTVATFADLGFAVVLPNAVPEPGTAGLILAAGGLLLRRRRRAA